MSRTGLSEEYVAASVALLHTAAHRLKDNYQTEADLKQTEIVVNMADVYARLANVSSD